MNHPKSVNRDPGGRVYYVEAGQVYEGREKHTKAITPYDLCGGCRFFDQPCNAPLARLFACSNYRNGNRGNRTIHPVRAVG